MSEIKTLKKDELQLFVDDEWIADSNRLGRRWFSPRKFPKPLIVADRPYEEQCPLLWGGVLRDTNGLFRMWYTCWHRKFRDRGMVCYAESEDGVVWHKPSLGICEFDGSTDNNICLTMPHNMDGVSVVDDSEDPAFPLKMIFYTKVDVPEGQVGHGLFAARSRDGIQWEVLDGGPLCPAFGDRMTAVGRRVQGKFVAFSRYIETSQKYGMRTINRSESEDLVHWSTPELVLKPDVEDPPNTEFYGMSVFPYGNRYLGALERMHRVPDVVDTELAISRDTKTWSRTRARVCFIPRGEKGSYESDWVNPAHTPPIPVMSNRGNSLYIYYSGRSGAHGVPYPLTQGAIYLSVLRLDGFAALEADFQEGWICTPPIRWPGGHLAINADTQRSLDSHPGLHHGEVRVELTALDGAPLPGYERDACEPMVGHFYAAQDEHKTGIVRWGEKTATDLEGKIVQIKFYLRNARLYAFRAFE